MKFWTRSKAEYRPILCLDWDGVIHQYLTPWVNARTIPDPPVTGALRFIVEALQHFEVHIYSSRSHQFLGIYAMKRYLKKWLCAYAGEDFSDTPDWWCARIMQTAFASPFEDEVEYAADCIIREIKWPTSKPPALISIDDRVIQFKGPSAGFPTMEELKKFRPWNRQ